MTSAPGRRRNSLICRPARAIDAFIGESDTIGRGHGAAFLRLLVQRLISEGAPRVAIDPDLNNLRARRAYGTAGFIEDRSADTRSEGVSVMVFRADPKRDERCAGCDNGLISGIR